MKITVSKSELLNKLKSIGRIIQPKNSLPAYDNFLFEFAEDGVLQLTAGDEGGRISTNVECDFDFASLSFMVNAKTMPDGLKEIPEQPLIIELNPTEKYVEICVKYSNGKFEIVAAPGKEYPDMNKEELDKPFMHLKRKKKPFYRQKKQLRICIRVNRLKRAKNLTKRRNTSKKLKYIAVLQAINDDRITKICEFVLSCRDISEIEN